MICHVHTFNPENEVQNDPRVQKSMRLLSFHSIKIIYFAGSLTKIVDNCPHYCRNTMVYERFSKIIQQFWNLDTHIPRLYLF